MKHSHIINMSDHQIDARTVRDLMESPIVQTVLGTGVDRNSVMQAIEKRLRETGEGIHQQSNNIILKLIIF